MKGLEIKTLSDVEQFEKVPIKERLEFFNTYDLIKHGASINPDALAISFFLTGEHYKTPTQVTYGEFLSRITQTANLFNDLGIGPSEVA